MRVRALARFLGAACVAGGLAACAPTPSPRVATPAGAPPAVPLVEDGPGRERTSLDSGFRFALGHAFDTDRDFGHGTSYFSYLAKAGYGDGPAEPSFDDRAFRDVDVPHDWAVELPFDAKGGHSHGYKALGRAFPENSVGWYRRTFDVSEADRGRRIALEFDGIYRNSQVFVNGFLVAREPSGYLSFEVDVTEHVSFGGKNVLAVRVDATQEEGWYYEGAGIYRHVWLKKTGPVHVAYDGTFVTSTVTNGLATVVARATVANEGSGAVDAKVHFEIIDPKGRPIARAVSGAVALPADAKREVARELAVPSPDLWSLEAPSLHRLVTVIEVGGKVTDRHETPFGIRTIRFDPAEGFFLNEKRVFLKGTNNHQDHAGVGTAIPDRLQEFRIERLKAMGSNAYRASHHPPSPALLDACDRLGMLVIDENRLMGSSEQALSDLERMIVRDRNHPSVILWSLGNEEWAIENDERGARIAKAMQARANRLDPTRLTTVASSGNWNAGVATVAQVMGYNYIKHGSTDEHHGKFPWQPGVGTEETTTQGTRGVYFTDEKRAHSAAVLQGTSGGNAEIGLRHYAARPYLSGIFYWTGFDYRGESNPFGFPAISSQFGILDTCGFPKDTFHYLKSWWHGEQTLVLAPHWNFAGREGQPIDVRAFSNAHEVELFLNGKSLGKKPVERYGHAAWSVPYEPGTLSARGGFYGTAPIETRVETTGAPSALRLVADRTKLAAGRDLAVITVSAVDREGRAVPTADAPVDFALAGGGRILGVGNGDPSSHEPDRIVGAVRSLPFVDFREEKAPGRARIEATLTSRGLPKDAKLLLMLRHFGARSEVSLNGRPLGTFEAKAGAPLPSVPLPRDALREGANTLRVLATPFENERAREQAHKVPPALLRVETPAPPARRRLFNGLAQLIVQSTDAARLIELRASAPGLTPAQLALTVEPSMSASTPPAGAAASSPASGAAAGVRCLTEAEIERELGVGFKLRSELAVVRVAPDDVLFLRKNPGAHEAVTGKLSYDARGVRATGRVCRVGDTEWFEVAAGDARGFANGGFLVPATPLVDESERFRKLLGGARFRSADELVRALAFALERAVAGQTEPRLQAKVIGSAAVAKPIVLHLCCFADDSVQGEQVVLELAETNGEITLRRARVSRLCPRGTSGERCL
ncbi:MAG TPA: beta-galactosidase GalA [Polyangiaceae bacterium]